MSDHLPFLTPNLAIVSRRWPDVIGWLEGAPSEVDLAWRGDREPRALAVNGQQLASRFDPAREAEIQAAAVPQDALEAWVYGMGQGELPRRLLARASLLSLHLVPLSRIASLAVFGLFDQRDWLEDERLVLHPPTGERLPRKPFAAIPPCMALADGDCKALSDRLHQELNSPYLERRHLGDPGIRENLRVNQGRLARDGRVQSLADTAAGGTVWVVAAGPSLTDHLGVLIRRPQGEPLVAVDAALNTLVEAGLRPDVLVAVDGRPALRRFFRGDLSGMAEVPLVYFPVLMPDILDLWPGPCLAACGADDMYAELRERHGLEPLFLSGSVLHAAVDLARLMGAGTVRLVGADLGYPGTATHAAGSAAAAPVTSVGATDWVVDGHGRPIPSMPNLVGFLRDLELYIERHPDIRFVNLGRRGARIEGTVYDDT